MSFCGSQVDRVELKVLRRSKLPQHKTFPSPSPAPTLLPEATWVSDLLVPTPALETPPHLTEEPLAAPTCWRRVVNIHIVVFSTDWLLYKWLWENSSVYLHMVLSFHQVALWRQSTAAAHQERWGSPSAATAPSRPIRRFCSWDLCPQKNPTDLWVRPLRGDCQYLFSADCLK